MYRQQFFITAALMPLLLYANGGAQAPTAKSLPAGQGKDEFARVCAPCHGIGLVVQKSNTAEAWTAVVDQMAGKGAQGTDEEFELIVKYLTAHFGPTISINKADENELALRLNLSAEQAQALIHYRETSGKFKDWSDVQKVPQVDMKKIESKKSVLDYSGN